MRILIFEFYSAGGTTGRGQDGTLLREGFAMLNAVLADFTFLPGLEVCTILDRRLLPEVARTCYAGRVHTVMVEGYRDGRYEGPTGTGEERNSPFTGEQWPGALAEALEQCTGALVIAPETGGLLARLTAQVEGRGKIVLGSTAAAVATAGDKAQTLQLCRAAGLLTPRSEVLTWPFSPGAIARLAEIFPVPAVVKPVDGAGSQGVVMVRDRRHWRKALEKAAAPGQTPVLVQEYVAGEPVSVSCLVVPQPWEDRTGGQPGTAPVYPLTLNRQIIDSDNLDFLGVTVPYPHPRAREALDAARQACRVIPGLAGYTGVDLVLSPVGPVIMEVNPRLTAAYVALREVVKVNLAGYILAACLGRPLPPLPEITGQFTYYVGG